MFDISYYYIVSIGRSIDLMFGTPPTDRLATQVVCDNDLSLDELKNKYNVIFEQLREIGIHLDSTYLFLWFEDGKWNAFDISKLPEMSSWDTLREATGKYDI